MFIKMRSGRAASRAFEQESLLTAYLSIQLHDVSHFIPAKAHKAPVIFGSLPPHHDIGLKVGFPLHPVGGGGCPPFGKVSRCMAFSPHMVPVE